MKNTKDVKITFHILVQRQWKKDKDDPNVYNPLYEIYQILHFVKKLPRLQKFHDLKDDKFCFLESVDFVKDNSNTIIKGFFKSARNEFRPNIINKKTGTERKNPKELAEGDIEKTHFLIKIDKNTKEVYLLLEYNYHGIGINNIIDYFSVFLNAYLLSIDKPRSFTINQAVIPGNDFLYELQNLSRAKIAEVYFDKQLMGSKALNFSNRLVPLKQDLKLTASAEIGESLKDIGVDLFNAFNLKGSKITKVRIYGTDIEDNPVILDTTFMSKIEFVNVDLNQETGEVMTTQLITGLNRISNSL